MGRWTADGLREPTNLLEAAAGHYAIKLTCLCGHCAAFNPHGLWWHFERRRWDDDLRRIHGRFWCRVCGSEHKRKLRPVRIDLVNTSPGDIELPYPPDGLWKRTIRRLR